MKRILPAALAALGLAACDGDPSGPPGNDGCDTALNLAVGQTRTLTGNAASTVCLESGGEYTLVAFNEATDQSLPLTVSGTGVGAVSGPPNPSLSPGEGPSLSRAASLLLGARPDREFHSRLRERTERRLSPLVDGARAAFAQRTGGFRRSVSAAPPAVGAVIPLNVSLEPCDENDVHYGRVVAVSNRAIVVNDTMNPKNGLTNAEFQHIAATFDTLVYPINVANFGAPADINGDGRSVIFYTRAVNELTPQGSSSYVGGFFYARDLFPKQDNDDFEGCPGSNVSEMFYMLAADPSGEVNGNVRNRDLILRSTVATIGHEFQHLINASRRLFVLDVRTSAWNEDLWLNEGLSHIAEELLYYHVSGKSPRSNIALTDIVGSERQVEAFESYAIDNFLRYESYLEAPDTTSAIEDADDLAVRGAAWAFLRYAADRRGGNEQQFWFNLVNNDVAGLENLEERLGANPVNWLHDWTVSVYTDDAGIGTGAPYVQPSWNYRSVFRGLTQPQRYPLRVRNLSSAADLSFTLRPGTGDFIRAAATGDAEIEFSSSGSSPSDLRVTVVRTK
jgi:hypothetical protein